MWGPAMWGSASRVTWVSSKGGLYRSGVIVWSLCIVLLLSGYHCLIVRPPRGHTWRFFLLLSSPYSYARFIPHDIKTSPGP